MILLQVGCLWCCPVFPSQHTSNMADKVAVGVHVGCTSACVAVCKDGKTEILNNDSGERMTPAIVAFSGKERIVGLPAKQGLIRNSKNTVVRAKKLIGLSFSDEIVQEELKSSVCKIVEKNNNPYYSTECEEKSINVSPKEVVSVIYGKMLETVTSFSRTAEKNTCLAVPYDFSEDQRKTLREAAEAAGFHVLRLISEPCAATLAYGIAQNERSVDSTVLVYRLGGTSHDVSVVSVTNGMYRIAACEKDCTLGGRNFDELIVNHLALEFKRQWKIDPLTNTRSTAKLYSSAENVKNVLSNLESAPVMIDTLCEGIDFQTKLSKARFESLCSQLFQQCLVTTECVLTKAQITKDDIDKVILVGGSTRIPKIQNMLKDYFAGKEICRRIDPDEVIAYGAAVQASILQGRKEEIGPLLTELECMAKTICVSVGADNAKLVPVIPKFSPFPLRKTHTFTTSHDNQESVCLSIYEVDDPVQEEEEEESRKVLLGKIIVRELSSMSKGELKFSVTFHVRKDGSMHVHLVERQSNKSADVTIETS